VQKRTQAKLNHHLAPQASQHRLLGWRPANYVDFKMLNYMFGLLPNLPSIFVHFWGSGCHEPAPRNQRGNLHFWTRDAAEEKKVSAHKGRFESTFENTSYDPEISWGVQSTKGAHHYHLMPFFVRSCPSGLSTRICHQTISSVFFQKNDLGRWPRITPLFMIHLGDLGYVKGSWVYKYILRNWNWGSGSFDYSISLSDWWNILDHSCQMAAMQEVNPEFSNLDITMVG
jgi:hypothetical protein